MDLRPVAVDLFSGAGGMSLGFEAAGFDIALAVDNDPVHLLTHRYNFPRTAHLAASVADLSGDDLVEATRIGVESLTPGRRWDGVIDCLLGGPSCQAFSVIGKRDPDDGRVELVEHFARLVAETRPRTFVMENVPGLLEPKHRNTLRRFREVVQGAGYILSSQLPVLLNAAEYGVPQRRLRVFLAGALDPSQTPILPPPRAKQCPTVSEALDDLANADGFGELLDDDQVRLTPDALRSLSEKASPYVRSLRRKAKTDLSYSRDWDRSLLTSSRRTVHSTAVTKRFAQLQPGGRDPIGRLPRLKADAVAPTIRAGTGRDHGSFTSCRPVHHEFDRVITVREAARLQGFPDWFRFHTTKWHGFRQVGNAVPPPLARAVAAQVVKSMGFTPAKPAERLRLVDPNQLELALREAARRVGMDPEDLPKDVRPSRRTL